jgi:hypothetical protein
MYFIFFISFFAGEFNEVNANGIHHKMFKSVCQYEGKRLCIRPKDIDSNPSREYYISNKQSLGIIEPAKIAHDKSSISKYREGSSVMERGGGFVGGNMQVRYCKRGLTEGEACMGG